MLSMKEHRTADTEIIFETCYLKTRQVILTGNSRNTNLARGSVFSAGHTPKIIQHKSQIRALKPILKFMKTSKMKYLQINK